MRADPPHPLIRLRLVLLAGALAAWAVAFVVLTYFRDSEAIPVTPLVAGSAIAFAWLNGAFWWLELCYPHVKVAPGKYASRAEQSTGAVPGHFKVFFLAYGVVAVLVTVTCLRLVANG